jgi:lysophospholipase L1-like esterase
MVFIGEQSAALSSIPVRAPAPKVRSTYLAGTNTIVYTEGTDYVVDFAAGTLRRTENSRIPDFRKNKLFGQTEFDHSKFPGFGNAGFFAFVDYSTADGNPWPKQGSQAALLTKSAAKLRAGESLKIVAFGDSITAGGDATSPPLIFWRRWADDLQTRYPRAKVTAINGATGGDDTIRGLERLQAKVIDEAPDLVLIGFGMNDHNKGGVSPWQFTENLKLLVTRLKAKTSAEVVLFSAFPPNPNWKFGSHRMEDYAIATEQAARESGVAYADVFRNWQALAARKKPEDLLGNNINHPNDYGHWIYFQVFQSLGL